jgi:hypothetical protein
MSEMISIEMATAARHIAHLFPAAFPKLSYTNRVASAARLVRLFDKVEVDFEHFHVIGKKSFRDNATYGLSTIARWAVQIARDCPLVEIFETDDPSEVSVLLKWKQPSEE